MKILQVALSVLALPGTVKARTNVGLHDKYGPDETCGVGHSCQMGETCALETKTCCGKTYDSFVCECAGGSYDCFETDACSGVCPGTRCSVRSDCLNVDKCVDPNDSTKSLCQCKDNRCRKKGYDCLTKGNGSGGMWGCGSGRKWDYGDDLQCIGGVKRRGRKNKKWGKCKTTEEIAAEEIVCAGCDGGCMMGDHGCESIPDDATDPKTFCDDHDGTLCPATSDRSGVLAFD